mmetsp:Transcript_75999/g.219478  ORF Transcript_75999/g.219478 Transcript_75999/m.219478 type:complete len:323 (-) Transcript_75999:130-1098(-)
MSDGSDDGKEDRSEKFGNASVTMEDLRRDDAGWESEPANARAYYYKTLPRSISIFRQWPMLDSSVETAAAFAERFLSQGQGYSWTLDFSGDLFCELAYEGFLSTSLQIGTPSEPLQVMLPWNDPTRNSLDWQELHISRNTRKRAKRYSMTVDTAYDEVILNCIKMHGEGWLYRGLRALLRRLFNVGYRGKSDIHVGVHSFELWDSDGRLVAGDLGYTVGGVYTSMTGFRLQHTQGAGEVQLVLTAALLCKMGYSWWDLGMVMKYKAALGARVVSRKDFVDRLRRDRDRRVTFGHERIGGQEILQSFLDSFKEDLACRKDLAL